MARKAIFRLFVLFCIALLSGCCPGICTTRQAASGIVVDAISGTPLVGVSVSYGDEDALTDELGTFSFAKRKGIRMFYLGGEHPMWPLFGNVPLSFHKEGYVFTEFNRRENNTIALEPSFVPEGITALDVRIASTRVKHRADGSVLAWLDIECAGAFGGVKEMAQETRDIAQKIIDSGLVGSSPNLVFHFYRYKGDPPTSGSGCVWRVQIGWTSEELAQMDWSARDVRQWLNHAAFVEFSGLEDVLAAFAADRDNSRVYGQFIEKARSMEMPSVFCLSSPDYY